MLDEEYLQQFYAPNCGEAIPSQHGIENSMSAAAKRRVDRATENLSGKRCLIENTDESNAVEYAHCLPRSTKHGLVSLPRWGLTRLAVINLLSQLDSLEFAWNMPRFTLNVDARTNVIRRTFFAPSVFP
jgi:hypothetical protein